MSFARDERLEETFSFTCRARTPPPFLLLVRPLLVIHFYKKHLQTFPATPTSRTRPPASSQQDTTTMMANPNTIIITSDEVLNLHGIPQNCKTIRNATTTTITCPSPINSFNIFTHAHTKDPPATTSHPLTLDSSTLLSGMLVGLLVIFGIADLARRVQEFVEKDDDD
ncbi:hypothetical protein CLAFUW4_02292 [Fulvia fulva]|uniref:Uncharacterized protein n=1 Tax=Passalora fulva TaxID=5499 RepID=A0A9Q8P472_PASFU|nr:uncharacterized protein CLAFUR5_02281 [Fulvia fulva]KAK4634062.1 hypothetical protein CLAFUR4_02287 [Fulvia fulva]KAK4637372.1 hypothetical protein CLAFUR0_02291 [Fulvia fulva]UJO12673.1 hypothetical protein CLAFUR5_02281 [Fulvia fulva]WPV09189.1 hypothetical protein CLAFUW4_02292 [Fulvia fulva]WPV23383.1 hypothetical protein CLAFUW7_02292 [Fulvia fulva]